MRTTTTIENVLDNIPNKARNKNYLKPLCGLPMSPYFSALKIRWLIDNVPRVKQAVNVEKCAFGTIDTWLIWVNENFLINFKKILNIISVLNNFLLLSEPYKGPVAHYGCVECITNDAHEHRNVEMGSFVMPFLRYSATYSP